MHEGQAFKESHTYELKHHLNATSKSQASNKQDSLSLLSTNLVDNSSIWNCYNYPRDWHLLSNTVHVAKIIIKLFSHFSRVLDIPLGRRFRVCIHLLEFANWSHSTNIIQSDGIIFTGLGNTLGLMLNQIGTQLDILLSLLRQSMTLIIGGAAWSSDNLA
jgi:hypothetical protein